MGFNGAALSPDFFLSFLLLLHEVEIIAQEPADHRPHRLCAASRRRVLATSGAVPRATGSGCHPPPRYSAVPDASARTAGNGQRAQREPDASRAAALFTQDPRKEKIAIRRGPPRGASLSLFFVEPVPSRGRGNDRCEHSMSHAAVGLFLTITAWSYAEVKFGDAVTSGGRSWCVLPVLKPVRERALI